MIERDPKFVDQTEESLSVEDHQHQLFHIHLRRWFFFLCGSSPVQDRLFRSGRLFFQAFVPCLVADRAGVVSVRLPQQPSAWLPCGFLLRPFEGWEKWWPAQQLVSLRLLRQRQVEKEVVAGRMLRREEQGWRQKEGKKKGR